MRHQKHCPYTVQPTTGNAEYWIDSFRYIELNPGTLVMMLDVRLKLVFLGSLVNQSKHSLTEPTIPKNSSKDAINLSSIQPDNMQIEALPCGRKFCTPPGSIIDLETQAQFETIAEQFSDLEATSDENIE
ncbi:hypothetical protein P879_11614 [Paragonimus westermani]|uniref:Uncharacterized protein n=1 Tax=Paragonimus westermani TaxID=34504 RepID=A0A8T0D980_9TREM|nr:hypothetical protein P879_11614 [Paragonimus westermani]